MRDKQVLIRITEQSRNKIRLLSAEKKLAQITILEYLLNGKIKLSEFKKYEQRTKSKVRQTN